MLGLIAAVTALAASNAQFQSKPCADPAMAQRARCGTVSVPEDRAHPGGRKIDLNIIVIPAATRTDDPPLFDIDGGPGLADTKNATFYLTDGRAYSATRDVVLVDQRGTGGSNPLDCPELDAGDAALEPMYPSGAVDACRKRLSKIADLTKYTTDEAVADLEAVRRALGYQSVDLVALSYGTTVALRYLAEAGSHVRSAVLLAAAPPFATPPRHHARSAQAALDRLFADCAADKACSTAYPNLRDELGRALDRLRTSGGVRPEVAMERLRTMLYSPAGARRVPSIIRRLADGDETALRSASSGLNYYEGMYLSVTCSESMPWFDQAQAAKESRATSFGDYRIARQREACAHWPRARVGANFFAPIKSDVPVLFVSGERDPVTPASWARQASRGFTNGRQLTMPWSAHIFDGLTGIDTCFDPLILRFFETADARSLDATCLEAMAPPPFVLPDAPGAVRH